MKKLSFLLLFCAASALAQAEPPYIYKQFGFSPKTGNGALSVEQKKELDACIAAAQQKVEHAKQNRSVGDLFGVSLTECLTDEETGKGWRVEEKTGEVWQAVPAHQVARKLMGLE